MLRLTIELVPKPLWRNNLRELMGQYRWKKLREKVYADNGYKCAICGAEGVRLNCHEVWEYDDKNHIQRLRGFTALCNMCHAVKHIGMTGILAAQGNFDFEAVITHFCRVNQCDRSTWDKHYEESFRIWRERSKHQWKVDLGEFAHLVRNS